MLKKILIKFYIPPQTKSKMNKNENRQQGLFSLDIKNPKKIHIL